MTPKRSFSKDILLELLRPIAQGLNQEQTDELLANSPVFVSRAHDVIWKKGDAPEYCYVLASGVMKIGRKGVKESDQIVKLIRPGDIFGFRPYFAGQNHYTSCTTITHCVFCRIPMNYVGKLIGTEPQVAALFLRLMSIDLWLADARFVSMTQKHLRGRLAEALIFLDKYYGRTKDHKTLAVELAREELANMANMTTANAIRTLSAFVSEGILNVDKRTIQILDYDSLVDVSRHD